MTRSLDEKLNSTSDEG